MRRRLHLRLYFAFLGVLFAITVTTVTLNIVTGRSIIGLWRGGPRMASHLGRMMPPEVDLRRAVDELHDDLGLDLAVADRDGRTLASAGRNAPSVNAAAVAEVTQRPGWLPGRVVGAPVRGRPGVVVLVRVPLSTAAIVRPLLILAGVLLLSFALVYPLSRSITRPLERLTAAVEAYGNGDLKRRSGVSGLENEVGQLARSFDVMADRIEAARRAEKELLANVSHELRTPLARIKVALELVPPQDLATASRIAQVSEEVDELDRLVGEVLTATRLDLSALPLRKSRLAAKDVAEKARARALALDPRMHIDVQAEPGLSFPADEPLLSRALDNLLDNARKYGASPVRIRAAREGSTAVVRVTDSGKGFSLADLPRVFDPFFRGSATRASADGFGLGLALVRRVALAHGGEAHASNDEAGGACIELRIPVEAA